ncbi:gag/pol protein [Cucumis melo var. makuwa]|uniref:Gag/pol protein n=1 Tax=Cucumis melo var. makuwa TaxID=1194695 RepID=A0A5D3E5X8_CUCMM|nr:gag/pol protein [Cucumis melo var. makuwa]TYK30715.1 gag/pol protein [Cucumis melo var. makuwa]
MVVRQPDRYLGLSEAQIIIPDDGIEDLLTYKQAMNDVDCDQWIKVMDLEMESMYSNSVWILVDQPSEMDVKTAFLNGNLGESIYMVQPEGFDTAMKSYGFEQTVDEPCVYKRIINSTVAFLVLYVDDILLIGNDVGHLTDIKEWLATQFQMKDLRNAQYVLEFQKGSAAVQICNLFIKRTMSKTPQEVEDMSNIPYASAVGSLMYAMLSVKNILKYLRRMKNYMIMYGSKDLILIGYIDSDFQTGKDARKSTSGSVFTLNEGAVL